MTERFYVTTPIYYVNDRPHIGHAYCTVLADVAARWHRLLGARSYFLTGTDEHGQKVEEAAARRGVEPQAHCDELHAAFKSLWPELLCAPDQFIRTTEPRHKAVVARALQRMHDAGLIVPREFEGWYCVPDERFWTEKELTADACPECGRAVVRLREKNWFFRMGSYQRALQDAIRSGRMAIVPPNRANEVLGFLDKPLQDLCISRPKARLRWGIELPFDPDYVTYVWFDALLNYATAVGFQGADPPGDGARWPDPDQGALANFAAWWPAVTHFLGKDILTTHAVYWPTMLMGLAEAFGVARDAWLPRRLVTTGWWLVDDTKMSKSLGNVVSPGVLAGRYGAEVLRYFLVREMAVGQDANFSEEALVRRNNDDLANDLGNLLQRAGALVGKHFGAKVPAPRSHEPQTAAQAAVKAAVDRLLAAGVDAGDPTEIAPFSASVRAFRFHKALGDVFALVGRLNALIQHDAPFRTARDDPDAAAQTLWFALEGLRIAAVLVEAVLPVAAPEILRRIGAAGLPRTLPDLAWGRLPPGAPVEVGAPLFAKHVWSPPEPPVATAPAGPAPTAASDPIDIAAFSACALRVGTVVAAEAVPKSSRLLRLEVDLGEGAPRQIVAGIADSFAPAALVGQQVTVLANLAPRRLMGLDSRGMVLVADDGAGGKALVAPSRAVAPGSAVR